MFFATPEAQAHLSLFTPGPTFDLAASVTLAEASVPVPNHSWSFVTAKALRDSGRTQQCFRNITQQRNVCELSHSTGATWPRATAPRTQHNCSKRCAMNGRYPTIAKSQGTQHPHWSRGPHELSVAAAAALAPCSRPSMVQCPAALPLIDWAHRLPS